MQCRKKVWITVMKARDQMLKEVLKVWSLKDIKCLVRNVMKAMVESSFVLNTHQAKTHLLNTVFNINADHLTPDINELWTNWMIHWVGKELLIQAAYNFLFSVPLFDLTRITLAPTKWQHVINNKWCWLTTSVNISHRSMVHRHAVWGKKVRCIST